MLHLFDHVVLLGLLVLVVEVGHLVFSGRLAGGTSLGQLVLLSAQAGLLSGGRSDALLALQTGRLLFVVIVYFHEVVDLLVTLARLPFLLALALLSCLLQLVYADARHFRRSFQVCLAVTIFFSQLSWMVMHL